MREFLTDAVRFVAFLFAWLVTIIIVSLLLNIQEPMNGWAGISFAIGWIMKDVWK